MATNPLVCRLTTSIDRVADAARRHWGSGGGASSVWNTVESIVPQHMSNTDAWPQPELIGIRDYDDLVFSRSSLIRICLGQHEPFGANALGASLAPNAHANVTSSLQELAAELHPNWLSEVAPYLPYAEERVEVHNRHPSLFFKGDHFVEVAKWALASALSMVAATDVSRRVQSAAREVHMGNQQLSSEILSAFGVPGFQTTALELGVRTAEGPVADPCAPEDDTRRHCTDITNPVEFTLTPDIAANPDAFLAPPGDTVFDPGVDSVWSGSAYFRDRASGISASTMCFHGWGHRKTVILCSLHRRTAARSDYLLWWAYRMLRAAQVERSQWKALIAVLAFRSALNGINSIAGTIVHEATHAALNALPHCNDEWRGVFNAPQLVQNIVTQCLNGRHGAPINSGPESQTPLRYISGGSVITPTQQRDTTGSFLSPSQFIAASAHLGTGPSYSAQRDLIFRVAMSAKCSTRFPAHRTEGMLTETLVTRGGCQEVRDLDSGGWLPVPPPPHLRDSPVPNLRSGDTLVYDRRSATWVVT